MDKFIKQINKALTKGETVVFSSNCEIKYSGRAESFLPDGDRIFLIKPDKTLVIHQPEGSAPVNYMKANSEHKIIRDGNETYMTSTNKKLKEYMEIRINKLHFFNSSPQNDGQKIQLEGTEKDMSEYLYAHPELIEAGFKPLSREEHTKYGFIDLFGYDKNKTLVVVECKRYRADLAAVTQLRRYVEKIKKSKGIKRVRGIIAAPEISKNALKMLNDWEFSFKKAQPPKRRKRVRGQKKLGEF
ncbi:MAG: endonuclease NucS [Nanoarchaeota archaeon]|nr:endonuclease NucS [Nanoarchaeota archaeon]